jgi:hypothetical protein
MIQRRLALSAGPGDGEDSVDPPSSHGYSNEKGAMMRICGCRAAAFKNARLYPNTAEGWKNHKKSRPHQNWLLSRSNATAIAIPPGHDDDHAVVVEDDAGRGNRFSDHPFASQEDCRFLATIAARYCLTFDVADRFSRLILLLIIVAVIVILLLLLPLLPIFLPLPELLCFHSEVYPPSPLSHPPPRPAHCLQGD